MQPKSTTQGTQSSGYGNKAGASGAEIRFISLAAQAAIKEKAETEGNTKATERDFAREKSHGKEGNRQRDVGLGKICECGNRACPSARISHTDRANGCRRPWRPREVGNGQGVKIEPREKRARRIFFLVLRKQSLEHGIKKRQKSTKKGAFENAYERTENAENHARSGHEISCEPH